MMGQRGGGRDLQPVAEINVTSMVDVAFTLLIIFIITAPILQGGIEVAVPETDVTPLTAEETPLIISVDRDGTVFLGETPMDRTEFAESFEQIARATGVEEVWIKGDSLSTWGAGVDVISVVARSGIDFAVVGTQRPER
jgi:biopolymer transport protein TolR